jgi:hypothetical protein
MSLEKFDFKIVKRILWLIFRQILEVNYKKLDWIILWARNSIFLIFTFHVSFKCLKILN